LGKETQPFFEKTKSIISPQSSEGTAGERAIPEGKNGITLQGKRKEKNVGAEGKVAEGEENIANRKARLTSTQRPFGGERKRKGQKPRRHKRVPSNIQ